MEKLKYVMLTDDAHGNYGLTIQTDKGGVGDAFGKGMTSDNVIATLRALADRLELSVNARADGSARRITLAQRAR